MRTDRDRRGFLACIGRGALVAAVGTEVAVDLGLATAYAGDEPGALNFGPLERLVCRMQETPADRLLPELVSEWRSSADLKSWVAAGALANARTFGGEDYVGFHTLMALAPAYHMAGELEGKAQLLPVLKVLYRNTARIQERGGRENEVLHPVVPVPVSAGRDGGEALRDAVRARDQAGAEGTFAALARGTPEDAFNHLLVAVHDHTEVHRVVLPYRAWDLVGILGPEHAHTLLRQSVRYCLQAEGWLTRAANRDEPRALLPRLLEEHRLLGRKRGDRDPGDEAVGKLADTIFRSTGPEAAQVAAAALADGMAPDAVGEAIALAANQLVLRDRGRTPREEVAGKPVGSVHGDSIGVHASDSANAWRNMARVSNDRNCFASLIMGAYQVATDRSARGGDFLGWDPLPVARHVEELKSAEPGVLLDQLDEAIRSNLQARASAVVHRYGILGLPARAVFDRLLRYAVSEDGSLHAEKFYRTTVEEFSTTRAAFRWRHMVALARVTASEFGRPAAGIAEARRLLTLR